MLSLLAFHTNFRRFLLAAGLRRSSASIASIHLPLLTRSAKGLCGSASPQCLPMNILAPWALAMSSVLSLHGPSCTRIISSTESPKLFKHCSILLASWYAMMFAVMMMFL